MILKHTIRIGLALCIGFAALVAVGPAEAKKKVTLTITGEVKPEGITLRCVELCGGQASRPVIAGAAPETAREIPFDPARVAARGLTASDVVGALRGANLQVAAGAINQPPATAPGGFEIAVQTPGRLSDPKQFANIVIARDEQGRVTRVRDVARVELGSQDYSLNAYLDNKTATAIVIFQRPGSNALETANAILEKVQQLSASFPQDLTYSVVYNPTEFIQKSIDEVIKTLW